VILSYQERVCSNTALVAGWDQASWHAIVRHSCAGNQTQITA